ncbi:MAG: hypothetical protein R3D70_21755 [Rhizobiaceae bacterium]
MKSATTTKRTTASKAKRTRPSRSAKAKSSNPVSKASSYAYHTADSVLQAASEGASNFSHRVSNMIEQQVSNGADMIGQIAHSTRVAADDMDENMPQAASLVRSVADRIDDSGAYIRDKSIDQLVNGAAALTRRQPAIVFGVAALAGFLALRMISNASSEQKPRAKASSSRRRRSND